MMRAVFAPTNFGLFIGLLGSGLGTAPFRRLQRKNRTLGSDTRLDQRLNVLDPINAAIPTFRAWHREFLGNALSSFDLTGVEQRLQITTAFDGAMAKISSNDATH